VSTISSFIAMRFSRIAEAAARTWLMFSYWF
jgi:hypothetical protein